MTNLDLSFGTDQGSETIRFRKITVSDGRHITQAVLYRGLPSDPASASNVLAVGHARVGKKDAAEGVYNFFAGVRIAFDRMLEAMLEAVDQDEESVAELRRLVQIELSIAENIEEGKKVLEKLKVLSRKHHALIQAREAIRNAADLRAYYAGLDETGFDLLPDVTGARLKLDGETPPIEPLPETEASRRTIRDISKRIEEAFGVDFGRYDDHTVVEVVKMNDDGSTSHVKSFDLGHGMTLTDVLREALR